MVNPCKNKLLALHLQSISFREERIATLAQLVEQRIRNAQVEGSNPLSGSQRNQTERLPPDFLLCGGFSRIDFAGFKSWDNYLAERRFAQEQNSAFVSAGVIEAARLAEGDVGDTAAVMLFVPGEPLLLSELSHRGKTGLTYLCGGKGGLIHLNFAILVDENADRASKLR